MFRLFDYSYRDKRCANTFMLPSLNLNLCCIFLLLLLCKRNSRVSYVVCKSFECILYIYEYWRIINAYKLKKVSHHGINWGNKKKITDRPIILGAQIWAHIHMQTMLAIQIGFKLGRLLQNYKSQYNVVQFGKWSSNESKKKSISKLCVFTCLLRWVFWMRSMLLQRWKLITYTLLRSTLTPFSFGWNNRIFYVLSLSLSFSFSQFLVCRLGFLCNNLIQLRVNFIQFDVFVGTFFLKFFLNYSYRIFTVSKFHLHFLCNTIFFFLISSQVSSTISITLFIFHFSFFIFHVRWNLISVKHPHISLRETNTHVTKKKTHKSQLHQLILMSTHSHYWLKHEKKQRFLLVSSLLRKLIVSNKRIRLRVEVYRIYFIVGEILSNCREMKRKKRKMH